MTTRTMENTSKEPMPGHYGLMERVYFLQILKVKYNLFSVYT